MELGFVNVASAIPSVSVADVDYNVQNIEELIAQAEAKGAELVCFPELSLTGYTCQDLFFSQLMIDKAEEGLQKLMEFCRNLDIVAVVGLPICVGGMLYDAAAVVQKGALLGVAVKAFTNDSGASSEKRWFASSENISGKTIRLAGQSVIVSSESTVFATAEGVKFGIEIGSDLFAPVPPSVRLSLAGADFICNLSAEFELSGKHNQLKRLIAQHSMRTMSAYVYSSCGFGESTQDVVFGGNAFVYENGELLAESERFCLDAQLVVSQIDVERVRAERRRSTVFADAQRGNVAQQVALAPRTVRHGFEITRNVNPHPFQPEDKSNVDFFEEIFNIQVLGLIKRLSHINSRKVVVGISGGLDSTLALLVCVKAFDKKGYDRKGILGVTMPGFGTTDRTHDNAVHLMQQLGVSMKEIRIADAVRQHFADIGHDINSRDVTYENSQARERTQILMDLSNEFGGLVIGTGDLSELALGWCTYNGDHMSMYGVNGGIPKTLIQDIVRYVAKHDVDAQCGATLLDIVDTPISPELVPADEEGNIRQKTEDLVGPYELHDFFLYYILRYGFRPHKVYAMARKAFSGTYGDDTIKHWLKTFYRRFFQQQFKRSCLPDGPKVGCIGLSPRGDWRMPTDASCTIWLKECEAL